MDFSLLPTEFAARIGPMLCIFMAAFLQAVTGFGLVIIGAPLLMLFYDAKLTVLLMLVVSVCANLVQAPMLRKEADWKMIGCIICGTLLGQPLGFAVYHHASDAAVRIIVSLAILFSVGMMQFLHFRMERRTRNSVLAGIISGMMTMTTGMAGPPLILYFAACGLLPAVVRATCICYFLLNGLCSLGTFIVGGTDFTQAAAEAAWLLPALILGVLGGQAGFRFLPKRVFYPLVFALLIALSVYTLANTFFSC